MTDPIFPLPEPTFLWVHDLLVHPQGSASPTVDAEGRWRYAAQDAVPFRGYVTAPDPREVARGDARGVRIAAVALAPNGTAVNESDDLEVPAGTPCAPVLVGRYEVDGVRPNPSHTRILLARVKGEAVPAHAP